MCCRGIAAQILRNGSSSGPGAGKWVKGGFQSKMDKKEAAQVLGLRLVAGDASGMQVLYSFAGIATDLLDPLAATERQRSQKTRSRRHIGG